MGAERHTARIGVFNNNASRAAKGFHCFPCRVAVGDVVVAQLLTLQLRGGYQGARCGVEIAVKSRLLVRVFAVA